MCGMFQSKSSVIVSRLNVIELLVHEVMRVFHDRLVNDLDRLTFCENLSDVVYENFKIRWTSDDLISRPFCFADFDSSSSVSSDSAGRIYKPLADQSKLKRVLEEIHLQTNSGDSQVVFFQSAAEHVLRVARVLRQPSGHMMLVGLDGMGKSTSVRLAAHIARCTVHRLNLTRGYDLQDFRQDLKKVYVSAGVHGNRSVLLLTDDDIIQESFLEDVSSILSSGEVADLFDNEEMDGIRMELRSAAAAAGMADDVPDTRQDMHQFLIQRVRQNLHVVLLCEAGAKFRDICRRYPSLINRSTIDWYNEWDTGAMLSVANAYFHDHQSLSSSVEQEATAITTQNGQSVDEQMSDVIAKICVEVHKSVVRVAKTFWQETRRRDYVTPFTYVEMMRVYSSMLRKKRDEMELTRSRLLAGLGRLSEANSLVGSMQIELVELGPKIDAKAKDTEALLEQLVSAQEAVVQVRQIVRTEEETMQDEKQVVHEYAQECQRDVDSVVPMLESAIESLNSLDKSDIVEIRVYTNPPSLVTMVIFGICLLLNQEAKDWNHARQIVADPHFLHRLIDLEKDLLPEKVFTKLKKYTSHPDFTPEKVGTVSRACRSLCEWVLAVEHHHCVFRMAKPKRQRLEEAEEALALARDHLAQKQRSLEKIEGHLKVLQRHYDDSVNQREALKQRKELTAVRLQRAAVLIQALSIEKDRWAESARQLEQKMKYVTGDMLLSSATVVYAAVFTGKYRQTLVKEWKEICERHSLPVTLDYSFVRSLATDGQVLRWQSKGLPHDIHSVENAVIIQWSRKWPLIIDPQGQAAQWIQEMEGKQLTTVHITNSNYIRTVENGIRDGKTVLIKDVGETLDPALDPIFRCKTFNQGTSKMIRIGGIDQEYNDDFRLYVTTSLFNPDYLPSVFNHMTIINFTVTFKALQEQLLSRVMRKEEPKLETERHLLMNGIANDLQTLTDLEDKTLALLHTSEGHILDRVDLIETLQHSKEMSSVIKDRVEQSERTEETINGVRKKYLPVATRGSVIYFVVADLAAVEVMYQFSLAWFQDIFDSCLTDEGHDHQNNKTDGDSLNSDDAPTTAAAAAVATGNGEEDAGDVTSDLRHRLQAMIDRVTTVVFRLVSTGLFTRHQLMFAFALYTNILRSNRQHRLVATSDVKTGSLPEVDAGVLPSADEISEEEWSVFLQGNAHEMITGGGGGEGEGSVNEAVPPNSVPPNAGSSVPSWLTESMWLQCVHLERSVAGAFDGLCQSMMGSSQGQWQTVLEDGDPYHLMGQAFTDPVPPDVVFPWHRLSHFQRLMILKIVRPSALTTAMRCFIEDDFGRDFVASHLNRLQEAFGRSNAKTPIIFVVSPGSNPMSELVSLAKDVRGSAIHLDVISLGRGQGQKAEELISKSQILKGRWIFLQNCHLAASWMPRLQAIVNNFSKPGVEFDSNFRLWLSSKSYPSFPLSVLQAGIKITVEPPRGVKAKLQWTYSGDRGTGLGVSEGLHDSMGPERTGSWRCLLFGLSFFNAVLQERWKYNQLGWNVCYDFNDADLEVSILQLQQLLTNHIGHHLPWPALWYVIGDVIYGGRVTDDWDRRCLQTMLRRFCNEDNAVSSTAFTFSNDQVYSCIPSDWNHAQVRSYIDELPAEESPELFGMDRNADEAARESEGRQLIDSLIAIQPRLDRSSETFVSMKTNDELVMEMAMELERRIPRRVECHEEDGIVPKVNSQVVRLGLNEVLEIARETNDSDILVKLKKLEEEKKEKGIDISGALKHVQRLGQSAMFTVLYQEIKRFEALLEVIRRSLEALILGVKGEVIMSKSLEEMYDAFVRQRMPQEWKTASYETCKSLGAWTKDLKRRIDFFRLWSIRLVSSAEQSFRVRLNQKPKTTTMNRDPDEERPLVTPDPHPLRYWLSAFYFPQGFLTALLQNHARKTGISVDTLRYTFQIGSSQWIDPDNRSELSLERLCFTGAEAVPPTGGAVVWGLYLDGAAWDTLKCRLCDSPPGQRFCALPEIHFCPAVISDVKETVAEKYECPIYQTTRRVQNLSWVSGGTQFVTSVLLDTDRDPERWILRGVALVCQLDD